MRISQLCQLDTIADAIAAKNGRCRYCDVLHKAGQCQQPKNWSDSEPARHSEFAILEANQRGQEAKGIEPKDRPVRLYNGYKWR